jgi:hypothetical protein
MLFRKHDSQVPIPFGPYIAAAGWVWFMAGPQLLRSYLGIFHLTG